MTLSTDFTNQVADAMDFVEFADDTVLVVTEEAGELGGERFELFLACCSFR